MQETTARICALLVKANGQQDREAFPTCWLPTGLAIWDEVNTPDPCSLGLQNIDEKDRPDAGNHILLGGSHHIPQ